MKILIAGLGSIGRRHLRNLVALGERDIILYRTHQSTLPDEELASFVTETDLEAALAHKPQAAIIANPTALHLKVAIPAAEAGCSLLLEKPVSDSMKGIETFQRSLERGGGQVLVGFQFRFHPGLQKIAELLNEEAIGRPLSARAHWGEYLPAWHPWEDYRQSYAARANLGGGVVRTLCHPFDYLHWLLGEFNLEWACAGKLGDLDLDVEDTAEVGLRFESGAIASIHLDYNQQPPSHTLEIIGTHGMMRFDNATGAVGLFYSGGKSWHTFEPPTGFERNWLFLEEMRHFLAVARGEAQPVCHLQDGIRVIELLDEIYQRAIV
jgi:predicted dehydrogenase